MANSMGEAWGFNHPQYAAIFKMTSSIEKRDTRGRFAQSKLELKNLFKRQKALELQIGQEMDDSFRKVQLTQEQVRQTQEIQRLQRQKLREEEANFARGRSDSKTIIDYHDDVIDAVVNALRAGVDYAKALETFYRTQNRLLEKSNIDESAVLGDGEA